MVNHPLYCSLSLHLSFCAPLTSNLIIKPGLVFRVPRLRQLTLLFLWDKSIVLHQKMWCFSFLWVTRVIMGKQFASCRFHFLPASQVHFTLKWGLSFSSLGYKQNYLKPFWAEGFKAHVDLSPIAYPSCISQNS